MRLAGIILFVALGAALALSLAGYRAPLRPVPETGLVGPVDRILVEKSLRKMTVFRDGLALKSYTIDLGFTPEGAKTTEGDGRTPEGLFRIDRRNTKSKYHLSLGLDYPQPQHTRAAKAKGVSAGGDIMIHGQPNLLPSALRMPQDWTAGCIAISNTEMDELFAAVPIGTLVELRP